MLAQYEIPFGTSVLADSFLDAIRTQAFFAAARPIWVARAPGRLDVMGGNVDYTGGMVLQGLLREAVWVAVQPRTDGVIRIFNPGAAQFGWTQYLEFSVVDLSDPESLRAFCLQTEGSHWAVHVLGAIYFLEQHPGCRVRGADLYIASNLPPNKGVSSSAALEVATLKAAAAAWDVSLAGISLATAAQWVENTIAGAACGIMDQAAIVLGEESSLLPILCQPCQPYAPIGLPAGIRIWGIDSMVPRSTTGVAYEAARAAAFMGYKLICRREEVPIFPDPRARIARWTDSRWNGYLSNVDPSEFRTRHEDWLPETLTGREFLAIAGEHVDPFTRIDPEREYPVRAAARYAIDENARVQRFYALLKNPAADMSENWLRAAGELLCQSHRAYAECGLGSSACDDLVARALRTGFPGAKMTGGGAGGVVAVLARSEDRAAFESLAREFAAESGASPYLFEGSSAGADAFGVSILRLTPDTGAQLLSLQY
jgi:galactokinase